MTDSQRWQIIRLRAKGLTYKQITAAVGCSWRSISLTLSEAGMTRRLPRIDEPRIRDMLASGMSVLAVSRATGVSYPSVKRVRDGVTA